MTVINEECESSNHDEAQCKKEDVDNVTLLTHISNIEGPHIKLI